MLDWLFENMASIIICVVLAVIVAAIIIHMIQNQKNGKTGCGCGCTDCQLRNSCHIKKS